MIIRFTRCLFKICKFAELTINRLFLLCFCSIFSFVVILKYGIYEINNTFVVLMNIVLFLACDLWNLTLNSLP